MRLPDRDGFVEMPRPDRNRLLFWVGFAVAIGMAVNFLAIANAAM